MHFSAPAKVILFGEHAVVYGKPAIAVPVFSLRANAEVRPHPPHQRGLIVEAADLNRVLPINIDDDLVDDALAVTARLVLAALNTTPPDVTVRLTSTIPIASGLGSGAAITTAAARAIAYASGVTLTPERLNEIVYEVEKHYHGTPSGIDNTVIVYEQPVYFRRNHPIESLSVASDITLIVADSGQPSPTKAVVSDLRRRFQAEPDIVQPVLDHMGAIAEAARQHLMSGQIHELGPLMTRNHHHLAALGVSSARLDQLVTASLASGALGAKLSGGGRGGNMIALVQPGKAATVIEGLRSAGAVNIFKTEVKRSC